MRPSSSIDGVSGVLVDLDRLAEQAKRQLAEAAADAAYIAAERARDLSPVDTGRLRDSWSVEAIPGGYSVTNRTDYAKYAIDFNLRSAVDADGLSDTVRRRLDNLIRGL